MKLVRSIFKVLGSYGLSVSILALMFLVTLQGTLAQEQDGLFRAQETYFSSWYFRDKWLGEAGRRNNQQLVESVLRERMLEPDRLVKLPFLVSQLQEKVETNLSPGETLSLLAAGLEGMAAVEFSSLPLKPAQEKHKGLRQLEAGATPPLWKEPPS